MNAAPGSNIWFQEELRRVQAENRRLTHFLGEYEEILREVREGYNEFYVGNNARLLNAESRIRNLDPPLR